MSLVISPIDARQAFFGTPNALVVALPLARELHVTLGVCKQAPIRFVPRVGKTRQDLHGHAQSAP
jgi:hypothetical protein